MNSPSNDLNVDILNQWKSAFNRDFSEIQVTTLVATRVMNTKQSLQGNLNNPDKLILAIIGMDFQDNLPDDQRSSDMNLSRANNAFIGFAIGTYVWGWTTYD